MKKFLCLFLMVIVCCSCEKNFDPDGSDSQGGTNILISASFKNVYADLKNLLGDPLFTGSLEDDYYYRITTLIYDRVGEEAIVSENIQFVKTIDTFVDIKFQQLKSAEYTIVSVVDIVKKSGNSVSFEFWKLENKNRLDVLTLVNTGSVGLQYLAAGVCVEELNLSSSNNKYEIDLKPIGVLQTFWFKNLGGYKSIEYSWSEPPGYLDIYHSYVSNLTSSYSDVYDIDSEYSGYYDQRYFLVKGNAYQGSLYWTFKTGYNIEKGGSASFSIRKGVNGVLEIDAITNTTTTDVLKSKTSDFSAVDCRRQSLKIGEMLTERKQVE